MEIWDDLVKIALLGTEHQASATLAASGPLGSCVEQIQNSEQKALPAKLLCAAAAVELFQRAGYSLARSSDTTIEGHANSGQWQSECPEDLLTPCIDRASAHLSSLLIDARDDLLKEWLEAATKVRKRPPHRLLPMLLEFGFTKPPMRAAIAAAAGVRARWLAAQNPKWSYVLDNIFKSADHNSAWETGAFNERLLALQTVRNIDAKSAIDLIKSTWKQDTPEHRAAFIAVLSTNLSIDDEPFLEETALSDRRKEIRTQAVDLLARLPESRLTKRMLERLSRRLMPQALKSGLFAIELVPPDELDKAMERDGIISRRNNNVGEKSDWLMQMIGTIDPNFWSEHFRKTPEDVIDMVLCSDTSHRGILLTALRDAAVRHRSENWIQPLLNANIEANMSEVFEHLSAPLQDTLVEFYAVRLRSISLTGSAVEIGSVAQSLAALLRRIEGVLEESTAQTLFELVQVECSSNRNFYSTVSPLMPLLARKLPISLAQFTIDSWSRNSYPTAVQKIVDQFVDTVGFRQEMHVALNE